MDKAQIFAIERPSSKLLTLYVIRTLITTLFFVPVAPLVALGLYFRYQTLRYKFDEEGISMRWGLIFRKEINLTYARIQDIHIESGFVQRWLGLADIQIQTASGSALPEMTIEGVLEYEPLRDFLYAKMRGMKEHPKAALASGAEPRAASASQAELVSALRDVQMELRATRQALEEVAARGGAAQAVEAEVQGVGRGGRHV